MPDPDGTLQPLLDALEQMIATETPGRYLPDGRNGFDFTYLSKSEGLAACKRLRDEVRERIAGRPTPASMLGEAVKELNEKGWPR